MAVEYNFDQISDMETEFLKLQKLEFGIKSDRGAIQQISDKYAVLPTLYTQERVLNEFIKEIDKKLLEIAQSGEVRGRVMAKKTMDRYLDASERANKKMRTLDAIERANKKRQLQRLDLYATETLEQKGILKSQIEIFKKNARNAGFSQKETIKQLVRAGYDKAGPVQGFAKKVKTQGVAIARREAQATKFNEYRKVAKSNEMWQWIAISIKPCPDCRIRAGRIRSLQQWEKLGTPGSGRTICGMGCLCDLYPLSVSEDLFPEAKSFTINKNTGVLVTASEKRSLTAKAAQPVQPKLKRNSKK